MTIDDSERYLRIMLGGMKYAVEYWKDKDKEESDVEQTNVEAVKTALEIMRKYQKIEQIVTEWNEYRQCISCGFGDFVYMQMVGKVVEDGNNDWQLKKFPNSPFSCGLRRTMEIIDKYKAESEKK